MGCRTLLAVVVVAVSVTADYLTAQDGKPPTEDSKPATMSVSASERLDALTRAQVWRAPSVPIAKARLASDPAQPDFISCKFKITELGGTAPKFDCVVDGGEQIRVKYGHTAEIHSEVAAARLLAALGFGADHVILVERLRCHGCPAIPFMTMKAVDLTQTAAAYEKLVDYSEHKEFEWVAVERKHPALAITTEETKGWAFFELDAVDAKKGGAPREHLDALRLMAVFLAHWDNKSENQRLVCLSGNDSAKAASVPQTVRDAAGRRLRLRTEESRSRRLATSSDLVGPARLRREHGDSAVRRRDVRAGGDHGGRPAPAGLAPRSAERSAADGSLHRGSLRQAQNVLSLSNRHNHGLGACLQTESQGNQ